MHGRFILAELHAEELNNTLSVCGSWIHRLCFFLNHFSISALVPSRHECNPWKAQRQEEEEIFLLFLGTSLHPLTQSKENDSLKQKAAAAHIYFCFLIFSLCVFDLTLPAFVVWSFWSLRFEMGWQVKYALQVLNNKIQNVLNQHSMYYTLTSPLDTIRK